MLWWKEYSNLLQDMRNFILCCFIFVVVDLDNPKSKHLQRRQSLNHSECWVYFQITVMLYATVPSSEAR